MALSFPARDKNGSRLIPVTFSGTTDSDGAARVSVPLDGAAREVARLLREDRGYRGVKWIKGPLTVSFTTEDTLQRSVRHVPVRGLTFRLCRQPKNT